jgi:hypothetical protein
VRGGEHDHLVVAEAALQRVVVLELGVGVGQQVVDGRVDVQARRPGARIDDHQQARQREQRDQREDEARPAGREHRTRASGAGTHRAASGRSRDRAA